MKTATLYGLALLVTVPGSLGFAYEKYAQHQQERQCAETFDRNRCHAVWQPMPRIEQGGPVVPEPAATAPTSSDDPLGDMIRENDKQGRLNPPHVGGQG